MNSGQVAAPYLSVAALCRTIMKTRCHFKAPLAAAALALATGCATFAKLDSTATSLANHSNPVVRYPAVTGRLLLGIVPGVPLAIVLAPVTLPAGLCSDSDMGAFYVFGPLVFSGDVGGIVLGGVPWIICGRKGEHTGAQPPSSGDVATRAEPKE